jgi:lysozyme family protein
MAPRNFDRALARLLAHEGGYVNHPADPGGPTKYGVTLAVYRRFGKAGATAADVRAMTFAEAGAIYRARYWNALRCDALPDGVDYAAFDYGVNSGVGRAARVLRRCVGQNSGERVDEATLAAVRRRDARALVAAVCDERLAFLQRLKTWPVFGRGWARRVAEVRSVALAMAEGGGGAVREPPPAGRPEQERSSTGKGVVAVNRTAQRGTAGGIAATGAVAAERAGDAGASFALIAAIVVAAALLALGGAFYWRWRAAREQARVILPNEGAST